MLTRLIVRNFKRFGEVDIELGNPVVFIGPNNSGKTTALQALALWEAGVRRWNEKRKGDKAPEKRPGVTVNRKDLTAVLAPSALMFWKDLHVREVDVDPHGKRRTKNIRIDVIVDGVTADGFWRCGLEFDYANEESFYCRPLRLNETDSEQRMAIPDQADRVKVAYLPPMSGLAETEYVLQRGSVNHLIGQGRTAEVLRNLCHRVKTDAPESWDKIVADLARLFGVKLKDPQLILERDEIVIEYQEKNAKLDLSSAGRGLHQTLLLLAYMRANPRAVILIDEPDAHLEILRQNHIYHLLSEVAKEVNAQLIIASHSEVILNEAAERDVVVAFIGAPHRINDRGSQVRKALQTFGWEHYAQAEQKGWVLYLESSSDLAMLRAFARKLDYPEAIDALDTPFVHYVGNVPAKMREHFYGLKEAYKDLESIAIFDRLDVDLGEMGLSWKKREIENYFCFLETFDEFARASADEAQWGPLFANVSSTVGEERLKIMRETIKDLEDAWAKTEKILSLFDPNSKVSDDNLPPLFNQFYRKLGLPNLMAKKNFHELAQFVPKDKIDPEVKDKLDAIVTVAKKARPRE